jgi:phosphohistidine phosphatase SixA
LKQLDLYRHAQRDPNADKLSPEGIARAEDVGRSMPRDYAVVFISPKKRAAETVAWLLRGSGQQLPPHSIVEGLAGSPDEIVAVVDGLFAEIPDGGKALAVGHTPLVEEAALGLTGTVVQPLAECEGIRLIRDEDGTTTLEELRR